MKKSIRFISVLAVFVIGTTAAWNIALADPDKADVTVIGVGHAPACDASEGKILVSNSSSDYRYKVEVTAKVQNHAPGDAYCCEYPCECDLSGTFEVHEEENREHKKSCLYDVPCGGCENICDNTDCPTIDFCTCPYGSYRVTYYSDDMGENYYPMPPSYGTPIEKEQLEHCPDLAPYCS